MSLSARELAKREALAILQRVGYHYVRCVATSRSSTVIALKTPLDKTLVAAKFKAAKDTDPDRVERWRKLPRHKNVVPLLEVIKVNDSRVFFMPLYATSLRDLLRREEFRSRPDSFCWTKTWIYDVAKGLDHLYSHDVCHLNLQTSNILIETDSTASIGGFGCTQSHPGLVYSCSLPRHYSPPECWTREDLSLGVRGLLCDLWSLGMVAFNTWTDHSLATRVWGGEDWGADIYPHMFEALQFENFKRRLIRTFPNSAITDWEVNLCLNFLRGLLHYDPPMRPDISSVLLHPVLRGGVWTIHRSWFSNDPMWSREERIAEDIAQFDGTRELDSSADSEGTRSSEESYQPTELDTSADCEESRSSEASNHATTLRASAVCEGSRGSEAFNISTKLGTSAICEESHSSEASKQPTGVREWLRRKWRRIKTFFC